MTGLLLFSQIGPVLKEVLLLKVASNILRCPINFLILSKHHQPTACKYLIVHGIFEKNNKLIGSSDRFIIGPSCIVDSRIPCNNSSLHQFFVIDERKSLAWELAKESHENNRSIPTSYHSHYPCQTARSCSNFFSRISNQLQQYFPSFGKYKSCFSKN